MRSPQFHRWKLVTGGSQALGTRLGCEVFVRDWEVIVAILGERAIECSYIFVFMCLCGRLSKSYILIYYHAFEKESEPECFLFLHAILETSTSTSRCYIGKREPDLGRICWTTMGSKCVCAFS